MVSSMNGLLQQLLRVSATTLTLKFQEEMTAAGAGLVKEFEKLIKALRGRFLLRGDWKEVSEKLFKQISTLIAQGLSAAREASATADREEANRDSNAAKFKEAILLLQEQINAANKTKERITGAKKQSMNREWGSQMIGIANGLADAARKVLIHAKDHPKSTAGDKLIPITKELSEALVGVAKVAEEVAEKPVGEAVEESIIKEMEKIKNLGVKFQEAIGTDKSVQSLKDAIKQVVMGIDSFMGMAKESMEAKKAAAAGKKNKKTITAPHLDQEKLMKRLELESRVIRARIILERGEKQFTEMFPDVNSTAIM